MNLAELDRPAGAGEEELETETTGAAGNHSVSDAEKAGTFVDEDNLGLSVTKNGSVYTMTDGDSTTTFNEGYLTSIKDSKENKICFAYGGKEYGSDNLWKPTQKSHQLTSIIQINKVDNKPASKLIAILNTPI